MKYLLYVIPIAFLFTSACDQKKAQESSTTEIVYILSEQADCLDMGKMACYKYKKSPDADSIYVHKGSIKDFAYLDGFNYTIKVRKDSAGQWSLLDIIEKKYDENAYMIPEEITGTFYQHARIKVDESTQFYPKIMPGSHTVLRLKYKSAQNERVADDGYNETILVEIENPSGNIDINSINDVVKAYYGKFCFCQYTGYAEMKDIKIQGKKSGDTYQLSFTLPAQKVNIKRMGEVKENVPYINKTKTYKTDFKKGSVMKMISNEYAKTNMKYKHLNGTWELITLNGKTVDEFGDDARTPMLEFKVDQRMYYGQDGCNSIRGAFALGGMTIAFDKGISTKMYCKTDIDEKFAEAFYSVNNWRIDDNQLILRHDHKALLVFKKKQ